MQPKRIVKERCSQIKKIALKSLQGKWGIIALGMLVVILLSYVPSVILTMLWGNAIKVKLVELVYGLLIGGPLSFGFASLCLRTFRGESASPLEVFYGFKRFGQAFVINFVILIISTLLGGADIMVAVGKLGGKSGISLSIILIAVTIWIELRFILSYYILHDQPELGAFRILKESCRLMKGNKDKAFRLGLSFIGWIFLFLILLGVAGVINKILPLIMLIPLIFLGAYMSQTNTAFYELIRGDSALAIEETEKA